MDFTEVEAGDWKSRLKAYENIIQMMANPTQELFNQLQAQLPTYLSDVNPTCQKAALTMCDMFFKSGYRIDYSYISHALVDRCLGARQQNSDAAVPLVLHCLKHDRELVTDLLFNKLSTKPPKHILAVISVIIAHLASLTSKDEEEAKNIIQRITPLLNHNDATIQREAASAVASAKIVCGLDLDGTDGIHGKSPRKDGSPSKMSSFIDDDTNWTSAVKSQLWKERKVGYEDLLAMINPDFPFSQYENEILNAINDEKHVACNEVAVQIIEKLALTFKTQLARRLREYITPVINCMKEKRASRFTNIDRVFDAVVLNATSSSPYDPPILEYIMKMLSNQSVRLREEAVSFIIRCKVNPVPATIQSQLLKLTEDPNVSVRDIVAKALAKIGLQKPSEIKIPEPQLQKARQRARSPDTRRSVKRKQNTQTAVNIWSNWVEEETLALLNSNQWNQVTAGLDQLRRQFDDDPSCPHAVVAGIATLFIGRTFTPKVMINIVKDMLYYIQKDQSKITEDAINNILHFTLDKVQDRKLESSLFELMDVICKCSSGQFVFQFFYSQLSAKSPVIPARILSYFAHYISMEKESCDIDIEQFSTQIKPMFTHSDQTVRKAAQECYSAVGEIGQNALDFFKYVKPPQPIKRLLAEDKHESNDLDKVVQLNEIPTEIIERPVSQSKPKQRVSEIPVPKRSQSPKRSKIPQSPESKARNLSPDKSAYFSNKLLQAVAKSGSIIECKKGFDELEGILNKMVEKGPTNSIPYSEFSELLIRIKQWLKDTSTTIILPVTRCIGQCLKLIKVSDISKIPNEFITEMILLLNHSSKAIRNSCTSNMTLLYSMLPSYIPDVFLPVFPKLGTEAKIHAMKLFSNLNIEMDVATYSQFIVTCLSNKSEEFREVANPVIARYLLLPDAMSYIEKSSEQYPPAKKNNIKSHANAILRSFNQMQEQKIEMQLFKQQPTQDDLNYRMTIVDPFLPLKILNSDEEPESLGELLQNLAETYFPSSVLRTDTESIVNTCRLFIEIANKCYNGLNLVLDIIFLWWANQALLIRHQEGFTEIIKFLKTLIGILSKHNKVLSQYEISLILPTVLECMGRNQELWREVQDDIFNICDKNTLLDVLVKIIEIATSVFALSATFNALMDIIPTTNVEKYIPELKDTTAKILGLVSANKEQNLELYEIVSKFSEFFDQISAPKNTRSPSKQKKMHMSPKRQQPQENEDLPSRSNQHSSPSRKDFSVCFLNEAIETQCTEPPYKVYEKLAGMMSSDLQIAIRSLKYISALLKSDEKVLVPHLDYLIISLILKVHVKDIPSKNGDDDLQLKHYKHTLLCLLTLFNESSLFSLIKKEHIQQIVYEMITLLSNGTKEPKPDKVITDVLNAIIVKLIDECTMFSFIALLSAIGEFDSGNKFSEKWFRLAIKCFEACGERIFEEGNKDEMINTFLLIDEFFETHEINRIEDTHIGTKVFNAIKNYGLLVMQRYENVIRSKESMKKLGEDSIFLGILEDLQ